MPFGISHFAIKVRDVAAAELFYADVLGLRVDRRWPEASGQGLRSVWLDTGDGDGTFLALEAVVGLSPGLSPHAAGDGEPDGEQDGEQPGHHLLALRIRRNQRLAFEERLRSAGVTVSHRTRYSLYFRDPEGNRLAVSHYPDAADGPDVPPQPSTEDPT